MPKNNDAHLFFRKGYNFRIFVTSSKIQNPDSNLTHFSDFMTGDQKKTYNESKFCPGRIYSFFTT